MATQYAIYAAPVTTNWSAGTARTVIEGVTGSSVPNEWIEYVVYNMAATGYTIVDFCTYSATGTGSAYTAKRAGTGVGTAISTWKVNMTVEGTGGAIVWSEVYANPFTLRMQYPLGREFFHSTSTVQGIRLTTSVVPDSTHPAGATLLIEE